LLNLGTSFEVRGVLVQLNSLPRLQPIFRQPFWSKVYAICRGTEIDSYTSFYALREFDVVQLSYDANQGLFTLGHRYVLPPLAVSSTFIDFSNGIITCSAAHGGLCAFDADCPDDKSLLFEQKPATCVLCAFRCSFGAIARVENGPALSMYDSRPFGILARKSFGGSVVTHAFEFRDSHFVVCLPGRLLCYTGLFEAEFQVDLPVDQKRPVAADEILGHVVVNQVAYLLSKSNVLYQMQADLSVSLFRHVPGAISRMFILESDFLFVSLRGGDAIVQELKPKMSPVKVASTLVGMRSLYMGSPGMGLVPHGVSHVSNGLVIVREGLSVAPLSSFDLPDPVVGLHQFDWAGKHYVAVAHAASTRFLEIGETEVRQVDPPASMKETVQTIGVAVLKTTKDSCLFQVWPDGFTISSTSSKDYPMQHQITHCISTSRQLLLSFANRSFRLLSVTDTSQIDSAPYEVGVQVTALAVSVADSLTGTAELVGFGAIESQGNGYSLKIQNLTGDTASRLNVVTEKMPAKVTGLDFLNDLHIVIGLENGCVILGVVDRSLHRLESVIACHYGIGPCNICRYSDGGGLALFALTSRPALVTLSKSGHAPRFRPLAVNSFCYACALPGMVKSPCFLSDNGRCLAINALLMESGDDYTIQKIPVPGGNIVAVRVLEKTQFVFVAVPNAVLVYDEIKTTALHSLEKYENEKVVCIDANVAMSPSCLAIATRAPDGRFVIRLHILSISQSSVQVSAPVIARTDFEIGPIRVVSVSNVGNVVAAARDNLLYFKHVNGSLQLAAQFGGLGTRIRHLIYSPMVGQPSAHGIIYVGDSARSVKLLRYMEDSKQFQLFCEEGSVRSITALAPYSDSAVCGGDLLGNVFILEYSQILLTTTTVLDPNLFRAPRRLNLKVNYGVGDVVTGTSFTADLFQCLWYTTVSGAFGGIIAVNSQGLDPDWVAEHGKRLRMLRLVEIELSSIVFQMTGCDHISFRNRHYPAANVIDLDLLDMFTLLSDDQKMRVARKVGDACKGNAAMKSFETLTPAMIELETARCTNYFLDWQKKAK
jgi:hypothetical protein